MIQFFVPGHDFQALAAAAYGRQNKKIKGDFTLSIIFYAPQERKLNLVEKGRRVESILCGVLYDKTSQMLSYHVERDYGENKIEVTLE